MNALDMKFKLHMKLVCACKHASEIFSGKGKVLGKNLAWCVLFLASPAAVNIRIMAHKLLTNVRLFMSFRSILT